MSLPLYTAAEAGALDRAAMEAGIPGGVLMERAGETVVARMAARWGLAGLGRVGVLAGGGNNGGDGYVVARRLREAGVAVDVIAVGDPGRLQGDAAEAAARWEARGGGVLPPDAPLAPYDLLVDALLGTGLSSEVRSPFREAIEALASAPAPVVAVDVPSGLSADSGQVLGAAAPAVLTVTFVGRKRGLFSGDGPGYAGTVHFDDLGIPEGVRKDHPGSGRLLQAPDAGRPPRPANSHKGLFGRVVVLGGAEGMAGAVAMAGWASLRSGAGWVVCCAAPGALGAVGGFPPELLTADWNRAETLAGQADALALGPGLGRSEAAAGLVAAGLRTDRPLVLDADGLNLVAERSELAESLQGRAAASVLTPHPGEAARLLGMSAGAVQGDRFGAARRIAETYGAVCCLKGTGTVIAGPEGGYTVCSTGNPGMSMAGQGDILTGILAAELARGEPALAAAERAVWSHGAAGDRVAAAQGPYGFTATECADALPAVWRRLTSAGARGPQT